MPDYNKNEVILSASIGIITGIIGTKVSEYCIKKRMQSLKPVTEEPAKKKDTKAHKPEKEDTKPESNIDSKFDDLKAQVKEMQESLVKQDEKFSKAFSALHSALRIKGNGNNK